MRHAQSLAMVLLVLGLLSCTAEPELDLGQPASRTQEDDINTARALERQATAKFLEGDSQDAEPLNRQAVAILEKALPPDDVKIAAALQRLALTLMDQEKYAEAQPILLRALEIYRKADDPEAGETLGALASCSDDQGEHARADAYYAEALAIQEAAFGPLSGPVIATQLNRAAALAARGDYPQAESLYRVVLPKLEKDRGPRDWLVGDMLERLATACDKQGKHDEAEALRARAAEADPPPYEEETDRLGAASESPGG